MNARVRIDVLERFRCRRVRPRVPRAASRAISPSSAPRVALSSPQICANVQTSVTLGEESGKVENGKSCPPAAGDENFHLEFLKNAALANWQPLSHSRPRWVGAMVGSGEKFARDGVFTRFLKQKGGIANIFMATFCCALSVRLLQQRKENEDLVETMEIAFAAERDSLRSEIDALKSRGWFASRRGAESRPNPAKENERSGKDGPAMPPPVSAADKKATAKGGIFV